MSRTILIMAGGTGGHVFPALAVAAYLQERGWRIAWLGTREGLEAKLMQGRGYEIAWLSFSGVRGKGLLRLALLPLQLMLAFFQGAAAIFKFRPDVVLGMGGYTAFPGGMMSVLFARPLVIHEQNSIAGLTNRVLACVADKVLVAFPAPFKKGLLPCPSAFEMVGNPVRAEIAAVAEPAARFQGRAGRLRLLVVGGSLGAQALNEAVPRALALMPSDERPQVVHQAGIKHATTLRDGYAQAGVEAEVRDFIEDMAALYAWCDVVICRAGALTIAELAAAGMASILVPFPHAVDDHQTHNAHFLSDSGAAVLLPQTELSPQALAKLLAGFTREKLLQMAGKARALGRPDATGKVAEVCMGLMR